jgi:GntR family transcriptional regulator/MocR family aminotransferase
MAVDWVGSSPEVLIPLDRTSRQPLGGQLQNHLRDAIRTGRLQPGERLPSSRSLAQQLGLSRGLVVDCYEQLESEGYLVSLVGSGTHVAVVHAEPRAPTPTRAGATRAEIDFEYGVPDLATFPMRDWQWALQESCRSASYADLGDESDSGSLRLREVLSAYLRRVRGSAIDPENLIITTGFRHSLNIVLRALAAAGVRTAAIEDPGPVGDDLIVSRAGLDLVRVSVDERGADVGALVASDARVMLTTPAHQCPTGVVLAPERRHALVDWAERIDGYVIEDDYDVEFRYDRQPVGSMQGLAPDRVIGMGTVSKTLAPALRIGWIACPPVLRASIGAEKQLLGRGGPALEQRALAAMIESGRFDRHLRAMRALYGRRRRALVEVLEEVAPAVHVSGLDAGCHAVLRLPAALDEPRVVAAARDRGVAVYGMSRYRSDGATTPPQLVLGFGNVTESSIRRGIRTIADLLAPT